MPTIEDMLAAIESVRPEPLRRYIMVSPAMWARAGLRIGGVSFRAGDAEVRVPELLTGMEAYEINLPDPCPEPLPMECLFDA